MWVYEKRLQYPVNITQTNEIGRASCRERV